MCTLKTTRKYLKKKILCAKQPVKKLEKEWQNPTGISGNYIIKTQLIKREMNA